MKERVPTDDELRSAGVELGLLEPGQPVPARIRARLAKTVQDAQRETAAEVVAEQHSAVTSGVARPLRDLYAQLMADGDGQMSESSAAHVVAALAPYVWRTSNPQGAAQHDRR